MSTLIEELTAIKAVEDKLTANKVANFAYTDHAYNNPLTEADGVASYDAEAEQNIPLANASVLNVNPTVLIKGWRAQASSITRMLMNHFLGRTSYNLNKINDLFSALLTKLMAYMGQPNGLATLDESGYVPLTQIPASIGKVRTVNTLPPDNAGNVTVNMNNGDLWTKKWLLRVFGHLLGMNWIVSSFISAGDSSYSEIAYSGEIFTVVGSRVTSGGSPVYPILVFWSTDGKVWNRNQLSITGLGYFTNNGSTDTTQNRIIYANGVWLIVYTNNELAYNNNTLAYSVDGKNFTPVPDYTRLSCSTLCIAHGNGIWVLGKGRASSPLSSGIYWSEDGINWTLSTSIPEANFITDLIFADNIFVGIESDISDGYLYMIWSEDGKNWSKGNSVGDSLYYTHGFFYTKDSSDIYYSGDGKNWSTCNISSLPTDISGFCYQNGKYFLCSANGLFYSLDGITWYACTLLDVPSSYFRTMPKVIYANGLWLMQTRQAGLLYSSDGETWCVVPDTTYMYDYNGTPTKGYFSFISILYSNGLWLATRTDTAYSEVDYKDAIWTSQNGIDWSHNKVYTGKGLTTAHKINDSFIATSSNCTFGYSDLDLLLTDGYFTD